MIIKKIVETVKICRANRDLRKDLDVAIEYISANGDADDIRSTVLKGAVVTDNEIATNCNKIWTIWGFDF